MIMGLKMWLLEFTQGFSNTLPSDLVFDPTCPIFNFAPDLIKANMSVKFHDYQTENVASGAYIRFF